ncbi:MAG: RNA ligase RtcB family protein [Pseudomonadota bacterium]
MGSSAMEGRAPDAAVPHRFYTSNAWIDGRADAQLREIAARPGIRRVAAFPDLHAGLFGPVGCAILADAVHPHLIGGDIGCGMSLFELDLPHRKLKLDRAERRIRALGVADGVDRRPRLEEAGMSPDLSADALGTIGGGNHFCEVQRIASAEAEAGLDLQRLCLLVHSGSRGVGDAVFRSLAEWRGSEEEVAAYCEGHDAAVAWARLNRRIIAERAAETLRADLRLIADAPHNMVARSVEGWLHRKGAAVAAGLVPLAGSRATASYVLEPCDHPDALGSLAHGAGRRYDRASMHGRVRAKRSDIDAMARNGFRGRIVCEDRGLLIEEAPQAYKSSAAVAGDLEATGAARRVAELHPLLTFKKTRAG